MNKNVSQKTNGPTWGLIGTSIWGILIIFLYLIVQIAGMLIFTFVTYGNTLRENIELTKYNGLSLSFDIFIMFIICNLAIWIVIKLKKGSDLKNYLAITIPDAKKIYFWILMAIFLATFSDLLSLRLGRPINPEFMLNIQIQNTQVWIIFLAAIFAASVFEEIFFRGFLFSGLSTTFLGSVGAIITTAIAWAALHFQYDLFDRFNICYWAITGFSTTENELHNNNYFNAFYY